MNSQEEFNNLFRIYGDLTHDPSRFYDVSSLDGLNQKLSDLIDRFSHEKKNNRGILEYILSQLGSVQHEMVGLVAKGSGFESYISKADERSAKIDETLLGMATQMAASSEIHKSNKEKIDGIATKSWGILVVLIGAVFVFLLNATKHV
jgi:hypothetical protein